MKTNFEDDVEAAFYEYDHKYPGTVNKQDVWDDAAYWARNHTLQEQMPLIMFMKRRLIAYKKLLKQKGLIHESVVDESES